MKIAITAKGEDLEAEVDPRFGRCQYFILVDSETMEFEALTNESAMASGGAGPQAVQFLSNHGVEAIITGNLGPNASMAVNASDIKAFTGAGGTSVREAIEQQKTGKLQESSSATVESHAGM